MLTITATVVTYNYLDAHLPLPRTELEKVARLVFMGFVASVLSDMLSNSLRVLKAHKQVSRSGIVRPGKTE